MIGVRFRSAALRPYTRSHLGSKDFWYWFLILTVVSLGVGRFLTPALQSALVWGSQPLLAYFALTPSLEQPMQQGAGLSQAQMLVVQEIARTERQALRDLELESQTVLLDARLSLEEKRTGIAEMGYNQRIDQVVRESSRALEQALGRRAFLRLVRWIEQRWSIERYLHTSPRVRFMVNRLARRAVAVGSQTRHERDAPAQQRTFRVFATHYNAKGAAYVALPDQCLKLTNGGLKTCESKGYRVGKEYSAYLSYKKEGTAARVGEAGPWNVDDNYWATLSDPTPRRMFADLALGMPEAQAAYFNGYNGGLDQYGRKVTAPFGIDLSRKVGDAIGLKWEVNDWVMVSFLWTEDWGSSASNPASNPGSVNAAGAASAEAQSLVSVDSVRRSTPDAAGKVIHQVQPGETLWSIAMAYQVSLQKLTITNQLAEGAVIIPGQELIVPVVESTQEVSPTQTPAVQPSATPQPTHPLTENYTQLTEEYTQPVEATSLSMALVTESTPSIAATTPTPTKEGINWGRILIRYDPVLSLILFFMIAGVIMILLGRLWGNKSDQ